MAEGAPAAEMAVLREMGFDERWLALIEDEPALDGHLFAAAEVLAQDLAMRTCCRCFAG